MFKTKFVILFLVFSSLIFCQKNFRRPNQNLFQPFYSEINLLPSDSLNLVYYSYRIPYNKLVFEKTGNEYNAGYRIAVEVMDSSSNFITRQIEEKKLKTLNFEETNSNKLFAEGLMNFNLPKGNYNIIPLFSDLNSNTELKISPVIINANTFFTEDFIPPLVVESKQILCDNKQSYELANFEGSIPFDESDYSLIIPFTDTSLSKINVVMLNEKDTVLNSNIIDSYKSSLSLEYCDDKILIKNSSDKFKTKNFIISNFSSKIYEGDLTLIVTKGDNPKSKKTFNLTARWFNKPFSLTNYELAIKVLKNIEEEKTVEAMLDEKEENYKKVLYNYWKNIDPTPQNTYNPLMEEFYSRVDYAARNFSTITGKSGIDTDRGKVYIQLGKPQKIDRTSNEKGKVVETWIYQNPQRRFVFTDLTGTGNFSLQDS
ncbi:MAG: GWxTD domain-containing protein [Ignavibacteriaceae bacterium]